MKSPIKAVKLTDDVWWVGGIDWNIRDFHGYMTKRGSTYNAYLIMADKITLIDAVKAPFRNEMMDRIASVVDPAKIDYIVSLHSELDHSGCLAEVIAAVNPEKIFASAVGAKSLKEILTIDREITAVKDGETLNLGNRTLTFMETRMLHWPDSMFAYLNEEQILFSQDLHEMFFEDAITASEVSDRTLTSRNKNDPDPVPMVRGAAPRGLELCLQTHRAGLQGRRLRPDGGPIQGQGARQARGRARHHPGRRARRGKPGRQG